MSQFGHPNHLLAMAVLVVAACVACVIARVRPGRWTRIFSYGLAAFLVGNEVWYLIQGIPSGFTWAHSLPLYLCDVGAFVGAVALIWPRPRLVELTYFWALAGSIQGLLTPDQSFPTINYYYIEFYGGHVALILAALFLVIGLKRYPTAGSVHRVYLATLAFVAFDGMVDVVTNGNYMYLRSIPSNGSLLSLFGPWPWYMVTTAFVAVIFLGILNAPFWWMRHNAKMSYLDQQGSPRPAKGQMTSNLNH